MNIELSIIIISKSKQRKRNLPFIVVIGLLIPMYCCFKFNIDALGVAVGFFLIAIMIFSYFHLKTTVRYDLVGNFILTDKSITIKSQEYSIDTIKMITIVYRSYKGEPSTGSLFGVYTGDNNQVILQFENSEIVQYSFLSTSKNDFRWIKHFVRNYETMGTKVELIRKKNYQD